MKITPLRDPISNLHMSCHHSLPTRDFPERWRAVRVLFILVERGSEALTIAQSKAGYCCVESVFEEVVLGGGHHPSNHVDLRKSSREQNQCPKCRGRKIGAEWSPWGLRGLRGSP